MSKPGRATVPFSRFEWMIAWRYLRARRREGGVSVMTWISLVGIALAVFALIATLAVRSGFKSEFVATILGANAHATLYAEPYIDEFGRTIRTIENYDALVADISKVPDVVRVAPIVNAQVMASANGRNSGVQVFGERLADLKTLPLIADPEDSIGDIERFNSGVAIGSGVARELNLALGDKITLISPDGLQTAFGTSPRISSYEVVYIFSVGRYDIDRVRIYMPLKEAQVYFNREGVVDELEVLVSNPQSIHSMIPALMKAGDGSQQIWTWKDASGSFLRALQMEDNIMFIIMAILVLVASLNIVSGLIMLVKNKGRDVGILRTMGLSEGSVLRVFFICGASIGIIGTLVGVILGCLFAIYIDPVFNFVNWLLGGGVWDPSIRTLSSLPAKLELADVLKAVFLSLGLSFFVTYFPARRAARMNPVEALRYE